MLLNYTARTKLAKLILLIIYSILLTHSVTAQNSIYVSWSYKCNYIFSCGFRVYLDTATGQTDSITMESLNHGFYGPNPFPKLFLIPCVYKEFF